MNTKGVIYILTNPPFSDYVKIGYANNIEKRLEELNRSECIPFDFRIYATYEIPKRLTDLNLHTLIDKLNPTLRSIDTFKGKPRKKEFYTMTKEDTCSLLEAIAEIYNKTDKLRLYPISKEDEIDKDTAELIKIESSSNQKTSPITLLEYLNTKNPNYQKLQNEVYDNLPKVEMYILPQYIRWRINGKYFAEIHLRKNKIMMLTLKPNKDYSIGKNVPKIFFGL